MESLFTKAEVARAKVAYNLLKNAGYPSLEEFIHLVEGGNIHELPGISRADIIRAFEIYGLSMKYVRGKMTRQSVKFKKSSRRRTRTRYYTVMSWLLTCRSSYSPFVIHYSLPYRPL
jgi:hypothetical protein